MWGYTPHMGVYITCTIQYCTLNVIGSTPAIIGSTRKDIGSTPNDFGRTPNIIGSTTMVRYLQRPRPNRPIRWEYCTVQYCTVLYSKQHPEHSLGSVQSPLWSVHISMGSPHWGVYNPPQRGVPTGECTLPNGDSPMSLGVSRLHKTGYAKIGYMRSTWGMNNILCFWTHVLTFVSNLHYVLFHDVCETKVG
jgi:hypothetical protein